MDSFTFIRPSISANQTAVRPRLEANKSVVPPNELVVESYGRHLRRQVQDVLLKVLRGKQGTKSDSPVIEASEMLLCAQPQKHLVQPCGVARSSHRVVVLLTR